VPEGLADVGVFGGSGFYAFLDEVVEHDLSTPWGAPSAPVSIGSIGDRQVAFLPRHGRRHEHPPHAVNYRANLWMMKELGVRAVVGPFACGSLQPHIHPGHIVVVDQLVDRTWGRADTYYDSFDDGPRHVSLADPYDERLRAVVVEAAARLGITAHERGTVVVIQGPRFSTRAESTWYRRAGFDVVGMTQYPEVALAAEAGLAYVGVALVTDYDTGLDGEPGVEPVTQEQVFEVMEQNIGRLRTLLFDVVPRLRLDDVG
jgi:5'-methylthioadenosine phosphorylase